MSSTRIKRDIRRPLLTRAQVAAQLNVHEDTVMRMEARKALHPVRLGAGGRLVRYRPEEVDKLMREGE